MGYIYSMECIFIDVEKVINLELMGNGRFMIKIITDYVIQTNKIVLLVHSVEIQIIIILHEIKLKLIDLNLIME